MMMTSLSSVATTLEAILAPSEPLELPPELQASTQALNDLWGEALKRIEPQVTPSALQTWIHPLVPHALEAQQGSITLLASSRFNCDYIQKHYKSVIEQTLSSLVGYPLKLVLTVGEAPLITASTLQARHTSQPQPLAPSNLSPHEAQAEAERLLKMQAIAISADAHRAWTPQSNRAKLNPRYTFEQFVAGQGNRFCHAAAQQIAQQPGIAYNPFFVHGRVGLGKTHLAQAVGHYLLQHQPNLRVLYATAEEFTNDMIQALATKKLDAFRDKYRKIDALIIDDVQFFEGKDKTQEELFHTFNALHQHNKQIILTCDRPPKELVQLQERLVSRFEWGLLAHIELPDVETRKAILRKKAQREGMTLRFHLEEEVLTFLAQTFDANIRELEGAFNKLTAQCLLLEKSFTLEEAQQLFGQEASERAINEHRILAVVAKHYNVNEADILGPLRSKEVAHARSMTAYLLRDKLHWSFPQIGRFLGNRKHSTMVYAIDKFKDELMQQPTLAKTLQSLAL
ncbi:MAG: chromosomal replication initiator protein DnaA [Vampirovibrionales bacterium]